MSGNQRILAERLRLGAGFSDAERDHVLGILASLDRHLAHWSPDQLDIELSVKDRGGPQQKVKLEVWPPGLPSVVANSASTDLDHALVEARKEIIRLIEDEKAKRDPRRAGRKG